MLPSLRDSPSSVLENPLELRMQPRVGTNFPVRVHSRDFPIPLEGHVRDLSVGGACVATTTPFAVKSIQQIELILPQQTLVLEADGRWQRDEPVDDLVLTGISFSALDAITRDALWSTVLASGQQLARFLYERSGIHELGLEEAMGLAQVTRYREIVAGRTLYRQDTRNPGEDSIFLLTKGRVALRVRLRDVRDLDFADLGPGEIFGGFPLVADVAHTESAIAESDCCLLEIDNTAYRYLCTARPWLAQKLATALVRISAIRLRNIYVRCQSGERSPR